MSEPAVLDADAAKDATGETGPVQPPAAPATLRPSAEDRPPEPAAAGKATADGRADWRTRFRREERREFRYVLSLTIARGLSWLAWLLPNPVRVWLADRSGDAFYRFSRTYRDNVEANLRQVLGSEASAEEVSATARTVFRASARNFLDLILTPRRRRERFVGDVPLVSGDWAWLDEAVAKGKGFVLFTAHLGAFDYIGQTLHARGYKLTVVTGRTTSRFVFDGVSYLRGSQGIGVAEATPSGVRRVMQGLRRGEGAGIVTDRDFFQNGKPVVFFGRPTTLPPGAVRLARDAGAPLISCFARRLGKGYGVTLGEPFYVEKTKDLEGDIARGMAQMVRVLEAAIAETPDQWVMFQRVWPSAPADPLRVFPVGSPLESELLERVVGALPERRRRSDGGDPPA